MLGHGLPKEQNRQKMTSRQRISLFRITKVASACYEDLLEYIKTKGIK